MRESGLLLHISSLPSPGGIGTFGRAAYAFVDFLKRSGVGIWQMLPLGPTGYGDSPYQSFSTFAGNPYFIDLEQLCADGLLAAAEIAFSDPEPCRVDYGRLYETRYPLLRQAFSRADAALLQRVDGFASARPWVDDYALFMALKAEFGGKPWTEWPMALRRREPGAMADCRARLAPEIAFQRFMQYLFDAHWSRLRAYAAAQGVRLMGDLPIYVSMDSADVWSAPEAFQLDSDYRPTAVAGVPPDYFSADGQLWGNPLYDWDAMARSGYRWWIERMRAAAEKFDIVRLDHFIGFANYYAVPADSDTARVGEWRIGPGMPLFDAIRSALPQLRLVAEDLGVVSDRVLALKAEAGFPGMKVLDFAFGSGADNWHLPHNATRACVLYTGTHDNEPIRGWWASAPEHERAYAAAYLGLAGEADLCESMIRLAYASVADTVIVPMQDYLELGTEGRMNRPSTLGGNWAWRMPEDAASDALSARIAHFNRTFGRWNG